MALQLGQVGRPRARVLVTAHEPGARAVLYGEDQAIVVRRPGLPHARRLRWDAHVHERCWRGLGLSNFRPREMRLGGLALSKAEIIGKNDAG